VKRAAFWATPPLVALVLYWPGLTAWFQKDDFAWLGLYQMLHGWRDLGNVLFHPYAQGTIRTISERIPYTLFRAVFGLNPLPFRCLGFATFAAITVMLNKVCAQLTGSPAAGFWAAMLWTVHGAVAAALLWSAIYYELLCALVFLLALWLLMRYADTGERRFYIAQWIVFLLGFGVLEQNVVYPALAAVYALCCARHVLRKVLPMFIPAAIYAALHTLAAPLPATGPYRMYWDTSVFSTLWLYWKLALGPTGLSAIGILASKPRSVVATLLTVAMLCFLLGKLARRQWTAGFFAAWFLIVLAPLAPLRDHVMSYYLAIPLLGFTMWGAWALVEGWRSGPVARIAAVLLAATYLVAGVALGRATGVNYHREAAQVHTMLEAVVAQAQARGANRILLTGVTDNLWASALVHRPLRLYGFDEVYVLQDAPKNELPQWLADPRTIVVDLTPWARYDPPK
jgi:hypothetical protein